MRKIGILLILAGCFWGIFAFQMETTVYIEGKTIGSGFYSVSVPGQTVHNLELADQKRNHLVGASITLIAGVLLLGFGSMRPKEGATSYSDKKCPFCAELIKAEATLCRFCGKELPKAEKSEKKAHIPGKVYELSLDVANCTSCPVCDSRLKLDAKEIQETKFSCPSCKSEVMFTAAA